MKRLFDEEHLHCFCIRELKPLLSYYEEGLHDAVTSNCRATGAQAAAGR